MRVAAACLPGLERLGRVLRELERIAQEHHGDAIPPLLQVAGNDERIAAVVARTCEHEYPTAVIGDQLARELRRCESGTLHEIRRRWLCEGMLLDRTNLAREVER